LDTLYSGTPLAQPLTGRHSIGRVSGAGQPAGVVASQLHSYRFHVGYYYGAPFVIILADLAQKLLSLRSFSYLCAIQLSLRRDSYLCAM